MLPHFARFTQFAYAIVATINKPFLDNLTGNTEYRMQKGTVARAATRAERARRGYVTPAQRHPLRYLT